MAQFSFDAVIFDLDGVITQTAKVHNSAWKEMFDTYLRFREKTYGEPFMEFTKEHDYLPYIDGKPRYKGVESFLLSRGIAINYGTPSDTPDRETICGLGNMKDRIFNRILTHDGVKVYDSTVKIIHNLISSGIKVGVASSSKNCKAVLTAARLLELFNTRVDGVISAELKLKGKPAPDIFTTAVDNLHVPYKKTIVVEDAVSGVQAGASGNFGLILGIARENNKKELLMNGADKVITDFSEITVKDLDSWFTQKNI